MFSFKLKREKSFLNSSFASVREVLKEAHLNEYETIFWRISFEGEGTVTSKIVNVVFFRGGGCHGVP